MSKRTLGYLIFAAAAMLALTVLAQYKSEYSTYGRDEDAIKKVEEQWADAIRTRQTTVMQDLLADDYMMIAPNGKIYYKPQELALYQGNGLKLDSFDLQDSKIRVYVGGVIVTGRLILKGRFLDTDLNGEYYLMDIIEPKKNKWQAVYRQLTKVQEEGTVKTAAK